MATPPDFSPGQVLTAAHMDAVGLWLVKSQTIGTAVSSVTVTDAFSADYENYKIVVTDFVNSASPTIYMKLNNSTGSTYSSVLTYYGYGTTVSVNQNLSASNLGLQVGLGTTTTCSMEIELFLPGLAKATTFRSASSQASNPAISTGIDTNAVAHTGFSLSFNTGTITGGIIRVYGYRN